MLEKLKTLIQAGTSAKVERNSAVAEKIPPAGLVIIRDGKPGEPDYILGGFDNVYYSHAVEIEIFIQSGDPVQRDEKFDLLVQEIGTALTANPDLEGLVAGLTYGRPEVVTQAVDGGPAIKTGVIIVTAEYEAATPLT